MSCDTPVPVDAAFCPTCGAATPTQCAGAIPEDFEQQLTAALEERYRIERELGRGGMAVVYLAHDLRHERQVAVKVLRPELAASVGVERFLREIKLAAKLTHQNVLALYDSGEADGFLYYVMPYVEGESLRHKLSREGQLAITEALRLTQEVAEGLDYAHEQGVIHRDIKPENILLSRGHALIADFGIAKAVAMSDAPHLTSRGTSVGTPTYMSPEQAAGDRQVDARSDVYSLGCVLYEMLAGEPPHTGPTVQAVLARVLTDEVPNLRSVRATVPAHISAAVAKALEKVPSDRYAAAHAFATALRPSRALAMPVLTWGTLWRRRIAMGVVAASVVLAVATWALFRMSGPREVAIEPGRLSLLVSSEGRAFSPDLSPDGSMVVYVAGDSTRVDLFVRRVRGGEPVQVTDDAAFEEDPVFSPDGERVAFTRRDSLGGAPEVWAIPTLGGDPVPVARDARWPAWSPDGSRLAFVELHPGEHDAIVTSTPEGGEREVVFRNRAPYLALQSPAWSPDGSQLAMVRSIGGITGEIWRVPAHGGTPRRLSDDPAGVVAHDPIYAPDGRAIIHSSNRAGTTNLWRTPLDGTQPVRLTMGAGPDEVPSVARDGSIAYVNSRSRFVLLVYDLLTFESRTLATHSTFVWGPAFSPDGRELAFSRAEVDGSWHIWLVALNDLSTRRLTSGMPPQIYPRFTPDGASVIYMSWTTPGRVWRVPRGGGAATPLTPEGEDAGYGDISPDGRLLAYVRSEEGTTHIYVVPMEGGAARRLTDAPGTLPRWSLDGEWIAFSTNRSYASGVFVIRPDGTDERRLTETGGWPTWLPDGDRIGYVVVGADQRQRLYAVPLDGGDPVHLSGVAHHGQNAPFDISRDGRLLATTDPVHIGDEIWLLERAR
jgi:serine/threonine-protein kinase